MKLVKRQLNHFNILWTNNFVPGKISFITPIYSKKQKTIKSIIG